MAAHWIPTTTTRLIDAGGNPIFDERNYLVGMMTKNTSRTSGHMFGVHVAAIRQKVDQYVREAQAEKRIYCPECGNASRAAGAGFFYCEQCGGITPPARAMQRYPIPQADAYYESGRICCVVCGSTAGLYQNTCLRCGSSAAQGAATLTSVVGATCRAPTCHP